MARMKYELTLWKIDYEDLIFIGDSAVSIYRFRHYGIWIKTLGRN